MNHTTTTIEVNGHQLEIPAGLAAAGLSGREINRQAGVSDSKITYEITAEGHRLIPPQEKVQVQSGERYGTMDRVVAGGSLAAFRAPFNRSYHIGERRCVKMD